MIQIVPFLLEIHDTDVPFLVWRRAYWHVCLAIFDVKWIYIPIWGCYEITFANLHETSYFTKFSSRQEVFVNATQREKYNIAQGDVIW